MKFQKSLRLQKLPPYIFSKINKRKSELKAAGRDLIDLGMGDPDLATPAPLVEELNRRSKDPVNHHYPPYQGIPEFRQAMAKWLENRFSVQIDPEIEAMNLIGSKEGVANFAQAVLNPGDFCLIPDPGYPVYINACTLAGATPVFYPLKEENRFQPDWNSIPDHVWKTAKMIFVNFPNNPTGATIEIDCYRTLVEKAKTFDVIVCSDNPYSEQRFDKLAPCFLQAQGAKEVGIEFFSCSKTYNMTGWRVGFAAGNEELIGALFQMKSSIDTGIFLPIQWTAIAALMGNEAELIEPSKEVFKYRRKIMREGLQKLGYRVFDGDSTFYLWIQTPNHEPSMDTATRLLEEASIVCTPGIGFGENGEGFFRMSLTKPEERLQEALERMKNL